MGAALVNTNTREVLIFRQSLKEGTVLVAIDDR